LEVGDEARLVGICERHGIVFRDEMLLCEALAAVSITTVRIRGGSRR
jgi:hypothetical protein